MVIAAARASCKCSLMAFGSIAVSAMVPLNNANALAYEPFISVSNLCNSVDDMMSWSNSSCSTGGSFGDE